MITLRSHLASKIIPIADLFGILTQRTLAAFRISGYSAETNKEREITSWHPMRSRCVNPCRPSQLRLRHERFSSRRMLGTPATLSRSPKLTLQVEHAPGRLRERRLCRRSGSTTSLCIIKNKQHSRCTGLCTVYYLNPITRLGPVRSRALVGSWPGRDHEPTYVDGSKQASPVETVYCLAQQCQRHIA